MTRIVVMIDRIQLTAITMPKACKPNKIFLTNCNYITNCNSSCRTLQGIFFVPSKNWRILCLESGIPTRSFNRGRERGGHPRTRGLDCYSKRTFSLPAVPDWLQKPLDKKTGKRYGGARILAAQALLLCLNVFAIF
jgi:hypothetical protein